MLKEKLLRRESGVITFGITPPKQNNSEEKIAEIAFRQIERLRHLQIDGLVIYDVQNESDRTNEARPFPYLPTLDPTEYSHNHLGGLAVPKIIYRCVARETPDSFKQWLSTWNSESRDLSVFVGAASSRQSISLPLSAAMRIAEESRPDLVFGGVTIPERHLKNPDEHNRLIQKMANGCRFFISQAVFNVEAAKNLLSDYFYTCQEMKIPMAPILFTLTPCGSLKTLEFMKWLGISIPRWLENDLLHSADVLAQSTLLAKRTFAELFDYGLAKGIPIGANIESVSVRKVEIDAAVELVSEIRALVSERTLRAAEGSRPVATEG